MSIHVQRIASTLFVCLAFALSACNSSPDTGTPSPVSGGGASTPVSTTGTPPTSSSPAPAYTTAVLLYNGDGVSASEEESDVSILSANNISYTAVTSAQLNAMTASDFASYGLFFVPGGESETMSTSLNASTFTLIQNAVSGGMGYLGICAGAFLAGDYGSWGLDLSTIGFNYYAAENQGITEEAVEVTFPSGSPNGTSMDLIWYGGPMLDGFGDVIGKYPDGTVAIAEGNYGSGMVLLSGVHPDAPASWRTGMGDTDTTTQDFAYVATLLNAVLTRTPLPHF
jgi:hypothetical protein